MARVTTIRPIVDVNRKLQRKGLSTTAPYPGIVVDDNDPDHLCRVRVRVPRIFDHLKDNELPWSIPVFNPHEGLKGGQRTDRSGVSFVAKKGHKVSLRFPTGDPAISTYSGMPIDIENKLPEMEVNYPFRIVMKLAYGMYMIIDTKTHEIFITNPGDFHFNILGDMDMNVIGNMTQRVSANKSDIPSYVLNAPDTVLKNLKPKQMGKVPFQGLWSKARSSNKHTYVQGDATMLVDGNVRWRVGKSIEFYAGDKILYKARNWIGEYARRIDMN